MRDYGYACTKTMHALEVSFVLSPSYNNDHIYFQVWYLSNYEGNMGIVKINVKMVMLLLS